MSTTTPLYDRLGGDAYRVSPAAGAPEHWPLNSTTTPTEGPTPTDPNGPGYGPSIEDTQPLVTEDEQVFLPHDHPGIAAEPGPEVPRVRILAAASVGFTNHGAIRNEIIGWLNSNGNPLATIVIGDAPVGGEPLIRATAEEAGAKVEVWNADKIGPAERDRGMVASGASLAFVFIQDGSEGASRVRDLAVAAGIPVIVIERQTIAPVHSWQRQ